MVFGSSDAILASQHPKLVITYCLTPIPNFIASSTDICKGDCINFTSNVSIPAQTYSWTFEGGNPHISSDINPQNICFDTVGDYTVTFLVSNTSSCRNTITRVNYIRVHQPAQPSVTSSGDTLYSSTADTYQWYDSNGAITNAFYQNLLATHSGYYHVCIGDAFSCTSCSDSVWLSLIGIEEVESENQFQLLPNPSNGKFTIQNQKGLINEIEIFSLYGESVFSIQSASNRCEINFKPNSGVYFVKLTSEKKLFIRKLIIQ
jgi:hypothetical protein